ncbi:heme exporter protein CcmD [Legionella jordanis]|uniref:Heme exporter protein D n=1 Tax=Legionella jordanis TaxID=456 RepID=A0A0W0VFM1_9GAMM|nr:heme exporter protein CcmD [Legionella jordanis]KTD18882.1 heme exporter protein CcmD [Legionella jordanis]VEH12982.1 cytochrome c-type biogenesis protein CcmD [Legionella jordanis]
MNPVLQWLNMGGYATYVWPAYGLVFGILILLAIRVKFDASRKRKQLQQWFKRQK